MTTYTRTLAEREGLTSRSPELRRIPRARGWAVIARKAHAYVWQEARVKDDVKYWVRKVGDQAHVQPVKDGRAWRFFLTSAKDFENFLDAIQGELQSVDFQRASHLED